MSGFVLLFDQISITFQPKPNQLVLIEPRAKRPQGVRTMPANNERWESCWPTTIFSSLATRALQVCGLTCASTALGVSDNKHILQNSCSMCYLLPMHTTHDQRHNAYISSSKYSAICAWLEFELVVAWMGLFKVVSGPFMVAVLPLSFFWLLMSVLSSFLVVAVAVSTHALI